MRFCLRLLAGFGAVSFLTALLAILSHYPHALYVVHPGRFVADLVVFSTPWCYLASIKLYLWWCCQPVDAGSITRIESLPKHLVLHRAGCRRKIFHLGMVDLDDLRQQLTANGCTMSLLERELQRLRRGEVIPINHWASHLMVVKFWVVATVLLGTCSPWLACLPVLVLCDCFVSCRKAVCVESFCLQGCRLDSGAFVPWHEFKPFVFSGTRTSMVWRCQAVILAFPTNGEAWLLARLATKLSGAKTCAVKVKSPLSARFFNHSKFVLADNQKPDVELELPVRAVANR